MEIGSLIGMPVRVHWHFRKKKFSVVYKGKVVAHLSEFVLKDARFKVGPKGNQRVRDTGVKNVHAFIYGTLTEVYSDSYPLKYGPSVVNTKVTYNPYKNTTFVQAGSQPIHEAKEVICSVSHGVQACLDKEVVDNCVVTIKENLGVTPNGPVAQFMERYARTVV